MIIGTEKREGKGERERERERASERIYFCVHIYIYVCMYVCVCVCKEALISKLQKCAFLVRKSGAGYVGVFLWC